MMLFLSATIRVLPIRAMIASVGQRSFFVRSLTQLADPVLICLSRNESRLLMPVSAKINDLKNYTYLKAFDPCCSKW